MGAVQLSHNAEAATLRILGEPATALSSLFVEVSEHIAPRLITHLRFERMFRAQRLDACCGRVERRSRRGAFSVWDICPRHCHP